MGSGTTLIAAQVTDRIAYGIELDPAYVEVTILRWEAMTGQQAVHAESGKTFAELKVERSAHGERASDKSTSSGA
jgi:DNA modification methylase